MSDGSESFWRSRLVLRDPVLMQIIFVHDECCSSNQCSRSFSRPPLASMHGISNTNITPVDTIHMAAIYQVDQNTFQKVNRLEIRKSKFNENLLAKSWILIQVATSGPYFFFESGVVVCGDASPGGINRTINTLVRGTRTRYTSRRDGPE